MTLSSPSILSILGWAKMNKIDYIESISIH